MGSKYTAAQAKATKKHLEKFDEIKIRVPAGDKEKYFNDAQINGFTSFNKYVISLLEENRNMCVNQSANNSD